MLLSLLFPIVFKRANPQIVEPRYCDHMANMFYLHPSFARNGGGGFTGIRTKFGTMDGEWKRVKVNDVKGAGAGG